MSDYQNIIEQSIHSIVDIAYKQGYQDGQKAVENEKYSTHTYWYQKGYEEGKAELSEEEVHNLMSDLIKGDGQYEHIMPDDKIIEHLKRLANDGEHPRMAKILNDGRMTDAEVKEHLKQLENDLLTDDDLRQLINDGINKCKEEHTYTPTKNNFDLSETECTDKKCPFYLNPDYTRCKECEEKRKAGIMTPVEIARLVAGEYNKHDTEQDKVTQWIKDNADFIKEMTRMLEDGRIQG